MTVYWVLREGKTRGSGCYYTGSIFAKPFGCGSRFNAKRFSRREDAVDVLNRIDGCRLVRVKRVGPRDEYHRGLQTAEHIVQKLAERWRDPLTKAVLLGAAERINSAEWAHPYR